MRSRWEERRATASQLEAKKMDEEIQARTQALLALVASPAVTVGKVSGDVHIHTSRGYELLRGYCDDAAAVVGLRLVWRKAKHSRLSHGVYDTVQSAQVYGRD